MSEKIKTVEEWLDEADFSEDIHYVPSMFALEFITFIKLVNGGAGEENKSPVLHYRMLDQIHGSKQDIINMVFRGAAKSTLLAEYLFLYIAYYGGIPGFGEILYALYVSDSIDNGVKKMRLSIENRYNKSEFLQEFIPVTKFTDVRWYFKNVEGKEFVVSAHGAKTGVRGTKELNTRPQLAVLDDLISDDDARSPTIIAAVEDVVDKAIEYALHPSKRKVIWSGTPFNSRDPLYKAVESGAYHVNVYPACNKFPCTKEEFKGAWSDRFTYEVVKRMYDKAKKKGKVHTFNQEMMLRIMSDEDRLVSDTDIVWYPRRSKVINKKSAFNFYITTDFATSEQSAADFSVISVWAYNNNGDWLWVDGIVKKQLMDKNLDDLFRFAQVYKPQSVGIEVSGQQGGFIQWIQNEMMNRNIYFTLASDKNSGAAGIRPTTNKLERFNVVLPQFKLRKIWFPEDMKESVEIIECMEELRLASPFGFRSKHDDFIDTISMLTSLVPWKPMEETVDDDSGLWSDDGDDGDISYCDSYMV